jgi:hypothetical protein
MDTGGLTLLSLSRLRSFDQCVSASLGNLLDIRTTPESQAPYDLAAKQTSLTVWHPYNGLYHGLKHEHGPFAVFPDINSLANHQAR